MTLKDKMKTVKLKDLNPAPYNPNYMDKTQTRQLSNSIDTWGYLDPIIVNERNMVVVGGHQRLTKLLKKGVIEEDVVLVDLDLTNEKALNLALNKIKGQFDETKLESLIEDLQIEGFDVELTGFQNTELESLFPEEKLPVIEDDYDPEVEVEPKVAPGDIWILGRHRLLCGDATKDEDMQLLMNNHLADLIITDPPYNVNYTGATKDKLTIQNDNMDNENFQEFLLKSYQVMYNAAAPGASIYVFHADTEAVNFRETFTTVGWKLAQCCIWAKQSFVMGRQDYHWQHEPVLYGWKPTGPHHWYSDRKQSTIWHFDKPQKNLEHPTMKPVELFSYPMQNSSKKGDIILDPFGGSGTTLIAAEQTERTGHTMELDPHYCDVIINRWEEFTGQQAQLAV
ncbi:MAG: site-specific DNA-methyltransferase [Methanobacterium sp.]|nr:site-specific DNA-methyltransferase [Methanobacterium sp.]